MNLTQMDRFKAPSRRPWLLLLALAIIAAFMFYRYWKGNQPHPNPVFVKSVEEKIPEKAVEAAHSRNVKTVTVEAKKNTPVNVEPQGDQSLLLAAAKEMGMRGDLVGARMKYLDMIKKITDQNAVLQIEQELGRINIELVMTDRPMPEKVDYVVAKGDFTQKIAKKTGTTPDLIELSNGIKDSNRIKVGAQLKILSGKFAVSVNTSRNDLVLYFNNAFFKRYSVATGKLNKTPKGTFVISTKEKNPPWWQPDGKMIPFGDKANILGTRWMSLKSVGSTPDAKGYGIHGTWDDSSIGKSESAGCVRMKNQEVEELYVLIPVGTTVTIE